MIKEEEFYLVVSSRGEAKLFSKRSAADDEALKLDYSEIKTIKFYVETEEE